MEFEKDTPLSDAERAEEMIRSRRITVEPTAGAASREDESTLAGPARDLIGNINSDTETTSVTPPDTTQRQQNDSVVMRTTVAFVGILTFAVLGYIAFLVFAR